MIALKQIDESHREHDLTNQFGYLLEFMGFGDADVQSIHHAAAEFAALDPE